MATPAGILSCRERETTQRCREPAVSVKGHKNVRASRVLLFFVLNITFAILIVSCAALAFDSHFTTFLRICPIKSDLGHPLPPSQTCPFQTTQCEAVPPNPSPLFSKKSSSPANPAAPYKRPSPGACLRFSEDACQDASVHVVRLCRPPPRRSRHHRQYGARAQ